jgi:hypothetical protein
METPSGSYSVLTDGLRVVYLVGRDHAAMGEDYGRLLADDLTAVLGILLDFFVGKKCVQYEQLVTEANQLYLRYPHSWRNFIKGVSRGSGLAIDDCKILNAMETLGGVIEESVIGQCSFVYVPKRRRRSKTGALYGRNYDFMHPFDLCSKHLAITVFCEPDKEVVAIVAIAGQISCLTGVNSNGIFIALNNGMPSGGYFVDKKRQTLLINLLQILQESESLSDAEMSLNALQSDFSLIINYGDAASMKTHEFSSHPSMHSFDPDPAGVFVSTNFFQAPTWTDLPAPTDETTWNGVRRRCNLLRLFEELPVIDVEDFLCAMDRHMDDGGAVHSYTLYQVVFDSGPLHLYVKIYGSTSWIRIELKPLFDQ